MGMGLRVPCTEPNPAHCMCLQDEVVAVIKPAQECGQGFLARERGLIRWGTWQPGVRWEESETVPLGLEAHPTWKPRATHVSDRQYSQALKQ